MFSTETLDFLKQIIFVKSFNSVFKINFVKSALNNVDLKAAPFNGEFRVTDQLPQEVREKRKTLIPKMLEERKKGNKATLVRDKLFVNGKLAE